MEIAYCICVCWLSFSFGVGALCACVNLGDYLDEKGRTERARRDRELCCLTNCEKRVKRYDG